MTRLSGLYSENFHEHNQGLNVFELEQMLQSSMDPGFRLLKNWGLRLESNPPETWISICTSQVSARTSLHSISTLLCFTSLLASLFEFVSGRNRTRRDLLAATVLRCIDDKMSIERKLERFFFFINQ